MIDTAFAHRLGDAAGLKRDDIDELSNVIDTIRERLDEHERNDFAIELMDAVRTPGSGEKLDEVLHDWFFTTQIRRHPDFAWQKKEYENLVASGELSISMEATQLSA